MSFQKLIIVGNLGREPEMRYTPGGQAVTNFSVATNRSYTNSEGETIKETTWFRCTAWGRQAETCNQYLSTGSRVLVEGIMSMDKETGGPKIWFDKNENPRANFEVNANRVVFLTPKSESGGGGQYEPGEGEFGEDEVPF